jgi:hypothetical protein
VSGISYSGLDGIGEAIRTDRQCVQSGALHHLVEGVIELDITAITVFEFLAGSVDVWVDNPNDADLGLHLSQEILDDATDPCPMPYQRRISRLDSF